MIRRCRILAYFLSAALAVTTLNGCTVNINTIPGETETEEGKEQITRGIPGEDEEEDYEEEDQAAAEEILESRNVMAIQAPGYTGLTNLKQEDNDDGTYFYEDMTEDGVTIITNMSAHNSQRDGQDPDAYAENFVCAMVDNDAEITGSEEDEELTEKFSYPVYKIDWESGNNEDTKQAVGIVVLTDNFTFYFGYKCPIDDYEDNQEFYEDELKNLELLNLSELFTQTDEDASESGEEEIEIPMEEIEEMIDEIVGDAENGEKKNDPEMDRAMDDEEVNYTMDDVAGYWKYEDYDEIYLALYDSGQFETYDMESGEVVSSGSYEVDDNEIVIVEDDQEPQTMQVISMVRLADDEGDLLIRFNPDGEAIIAENDEEDEESAENRLYGIHTKDDVVTEDAGKGFKRIKSRSRQVSLTYPYNYYSGVCFDDTLYCYDGDVAYVTARNLTGEFNHWKGSVNKFKQSCGDTFIPKDFTYFYGKRTGIANVTRDYKTKRSTSSSDYVARTTCNMWNKKYDIQCNSNLILCRFKDGTQQLVLLNVYYRWDDSRSHEHVSRCSIGAVKNY